MNLHWGKTLENKWVRINSRPRINHSSPYNYSDYRSNSQRYYYLEDTYSRNSSYNGTSIHTHNQFLKKSRILTDMVTKTVRTQSFTTVVVIASIFLFLTMTITAAVVVFCRKRNSVFALQKSEQEDIEYELEELNTDIEYTETEFESETESVNKNRKSISQQGGDSDFENSPARRPLVSVQRESEVEDSPIRYHRCQCGATADPRGAYQQMVVTAVLEKPMQHAGSASEDSDGEMRTRLIKKLNKTYYGFTTVASDVESDHEGYPINMRQPPMINITYVDDPPSYESIQHTSQQQVQVEIENCRPPSTFIRSPIEGAHHYSALGYSEKQLCDAAVVFVELPPEENKNRPLNSSDEPVVFVNLPPKPGSNSGHIDNGDDAVTPTDHQEQEAESVLSTPTVTPLQTPVTSPTLVLPPVSSPVSVLPSTATPASPTNQVPPTLSLVSDDSPGSPEREDFSHQKDETDSSSDQEHTHSTALTADSCSSPTQSDSQSDSHSSQTDGSGSKSDSEPG